MSYPLARVAGAASVQRSSLPLGEQLPTTFAPDLSIAQVRGRKQRQALLDELAGGWQPVSFRVSEVHFVVRDDPLQKCRQQAIASQATYQAAMAASVPSGASCCSLTLFRGPPWFWAVFTQRGLTEAKGHSNSNVNVGIPHYGPRGPDKQRIPSKRQLHAALRAYRSSRTARKGPEWLQDATWRSRRQNGALLGGKSAIRSPEARTAASLHDSRG